MNIKRITENVYLLGELGFFVIASPSTPPTYICVMVKSKKALLGLIKNDSKVIADIVDFCNSAVNSNTKAIAPPHEIDDVKYWATFTLSGELISFGKIVL